MRKATLITSALAAMFLVLVGASSLTAGMRSFDGEFDIGALLEHAEKALDLEKEDAVILFQRAESSWTADSRLVQTTHRAILIRTEYALDHYADLRILWDGARQKLSVETLRTFRLSDQRWIEAGPTAIVETLPFAVDRAPDYCHLRQTMLLHDGVELPCVLETAWTVEDRQPFRPGAAGVHGLMGPEPALVSRFILGFPAGRQPVFSTAGGPPQPLRGTDADTGLVTWTFEMENLPAGPYPETAESILLQPRVGWSTWKDWESLAADLEARAASGAVINDELREAFDEKLKDVRTAGEKARLIADFVGQATRLIDLGGGWWPEPRPASRTWATAYGHRVDRSVLAAALYREAGYTARPAFRSAGLGEADATVPGLDWSEGVSLLIEGNGVEGWFDPESAQFSAGRQATLGRTVWVPSLAQNPAQRKADRPDRMAIRFDLAFDAEKQTWTGTGVLEAEGTNSPFSRMSGLGTEALDYLNGSAGSILAGAKVTAFNPERFGSPGVTIGLALELPAGDRDTRGRLKVEPAPFPAGHLVDLHQETRESDVYLPAPVMMQLELHLKPGDLQKVRLPPAARLENGAGLWQLEVREEEDEVVLIRRLELPLSRYPAARWPELRTLLLAGENRAGRVLLFK